MKYPQYINQILTQLQEHGHKGWIVGGAVRDSIRGMTPNDFDIATTALPDEICAIFDRTIPIGIEHGTIAVVINEDVVEVTTLRYDGEYKDGRRPSSVLFTKDIVADLARRDFTINAMAYNPQDGLIDPFCGQVDLAARLVRCVGDPNLRFREDALRLMRAVRFATRFEGEIEQATWAALVKQSQNLAKVSRERISSEMLQILTAAKPSLGLRMLADSGLLIIISEELDRLVGFEQHSPYHNLTVWEHTLSVVDGVKNSLNLRLAALFHDVAKPVTFTLDEKGIGHFYGHELESVNLAEEIMERWRLPRHMRRCVEMLVGKHMIKYTKFKRHKIKKWIQQVGPKNISDLCCLMIADEFAKKSPYRFQRIYQFEELCEEIISSGEPLTLADLAVNGRDMQEMGLEGPEIGKALNKLLEVVLVEPQFNETNFLKSRVCHWTSDGTLLKKNCNHLKKI